MPASLRLALFYGAYFSVVGVQLPFWPVWLAGRGLDAEAIGVILAGTLWFKIASNPLAGWAADRTGNRKAVMLSLAVANVLALLLLQNAAGFWPLFLLSLLASAAFSALMPLGDNLTLSVAEEKHLDYGRIRLWGSVSFIAAALGGGTVLTRSSSETVLPLLTVAAGLTLAACLALPTHGFARTPLAPRAWRVLFFDRRQLLFLAAATAIQASHSIYYAFGTLHWRSLGYSDAAIGTLWAEAVLAEIALFAWGGRLVARLGPGRLLVLAGVAGVVRWTLTSALTALPLLLVLQLLHALTFGAAHLAAMRFLAHAFPPELSATGQSLYSATVAGIGFGLVMAGSGPLYGSFGGDAYLAMAGLAALGAICGWRLARSWHGERLA